jgi:pyrroloquinoline-quinone synthase
MSTFQQELDRLLDQYSLLKHPFYQQWSAGTLSKEALCGYVKEYFHLVKTVPNMVEKIYSTCPTLDVKMNMEEEKLHIGLWENFAEGMGISKEELKAHVPTDNTIDAVNRMLNLMNEPMEGSAAMYAYEADIPKISVSKLEGLKKFYGITDESTLEYFVEHETADIEHVKVWQSMMVNFNTSQQTIALNSAEESLKAQNAVLDSVCERYMPEMASC